jgi:hypothetical protein
VRLIRLLPQGVPSLPRSTTKITLKSGFIGIGTHKSILDYLYYSYLLNPVFVRLIIYKKGESEELYYSPLSFIESLHCALDCRGFDPIIVRSEREYKAVKYRKLAMKTLVSECFEELNGPIFILLPVNVEPRRDCCRRYR